MLFANKYIEFEKIAVSLKPTLAPKRITAYIFTVFFLCPALISAQSLDTTSDRSTFALQLNQDNSFNFFPVVSGTIALKKHDLTFYAIFWTSPAFTNPDESGSLIEVGVGIGFTKGNWYINSYLGFTHGMFTTGRNQNGQGRPSLGEAIVPGIIIFVKNEKLEAEIFFSLYKNLRKEVLPVTNYLFCWILPGIKWGKYFSSGFHYEQFRDISGDVAVYSSRCLAKAKKALYNYFFYQPYKGKLICNHIHFSISNFIVAINISQSTEFDIVGFNR